jgi:hypothetical protein
VVGSTHNLGDEVKTFARLNFTLKKKIKTTLVFLKKIQNQKHVEKPP